MTVWLVGAGPGDAGLMTLRGSELLARADVVFYDRLVDPGILAMVNPAAEMVDVGKREGSGTGRQREIEERLVEAARDGRRVVRLKGGDPFLFGRGGEEVEALTAAGIAVEVVPGVTAAVAVPELAGVPVTHRGLAASVTVVTGRLESGEVDWAKVAGVGGTIVVMMGVARRKDIAEGLMAGGLSPTTPVMVTESGSTPRERTVRASLGALGELDIAAPAVIVIGAVAGLDLGVAARGPLSGRTIVVTRTKGHSGSPARELRAAGARVLEMPVLEVVPPSDGGAALGVAAARLRAGERPWEWLAATSAHGFERLFDNLDDARDLAGMKIAAVGQATSEAMRARGIAADLVPESADWNARGLAEAMPHAPHPGARVLFPAAARAAKTLEEGLEARGWMVDRVTAYTTVPAARPSAPLVEVLTEADAVTFSSPSALEAYAGMADPIPLPNPELAVCIGATTLAAARGMSNPVGRRVVGTETSEPEALVELLSKIF